MHEVQCILGTSFLCQFFHALKDVLGPLLCTVVDVMLVLFLGLRYKDNMSYKATPVITFVMIIAVLACTYIDHIDCKGPLGVLLSARSRLNTGLDALDDEHRRGPPSSG